MLGHSLEERDILLMPAGGVQIRQLQIRCLPRNILAAESGESIDLSNSANS